MTNFRLYFNRKREAPQVWSLDEGDQSSEVNVIGFVGHGCNLVSHYNGEKPNEDSPCAWIEIHADYYNIVGGVAHFWRHLPDGRS